ncbi:MAG: hypothetical protein JWN03_7728 [Nocardia sp.]|uniref:hypothetical protein n=1 Tax=Nocardia sp. TaxID=1821 RepID=UPI002602AA2F|nr:hypothetical protein [Nocardia sp.]MCU1647453.1 hypothetical protein [Nocardia sp.]
MDSLRKIEIDVLREVIDAVEARLRVVEASGRSVVQPRSQIYAAVIHAVIVSARAAGHHGTGSLSSAPLLDAILDGAEADPWDAAIFAVLIDGVALN